MTRIAVILAIALGAFVVAPAPIFAGISVLDLTCENAAHSPGTAMSMLDRAPRARGIEGARMSFRDSRRAARSVEVPRGHERMMCVGNPLTDDPMCWFPDPLGAPVSGVRAGHAEREAASIPGTPATMILERTAPPIGAPEGAARPGHARGVERPPRIVS